ncbi:hypothetical protein SDC9_200736 [bioreactor metagenome]|uniref:Uncharacterized protein n=1 Tax=bioreactor metagenome TaxID=1076179 RepID=A0A645J0V1_9ZZZZ
MTVWRYAFYEQAIVGIKEYNIAVLKLFQRGPVPLISKSGSPFFWMKQRFMEIGCIWNKIHLFQSSDAALLVKHHATQLSKQPVVTARKLGIAKISNMFAVIIMRFIGNQVPINADLKAALGKNA